MMFRRALFLRIGRRPRLFQLRFLDKSEAESKLAICSLLHFSKTMSTRWSCLNSATVNESERLGMAGLRISRRTRRWAQYSSPKSLLIIAESTANEQERDAIMHIIEGKTERLYVKKEDWQATTTAATRSSTPKNCDVRNYRLMK